MRGSARCRPDAGGVLAFLRGNRGAAALDLSGAMAVGEKAVVTDAVKAVRQNMQEEAADELVRLEPHDLVPASMAIILVGKGDLIAVDGGKPCVGDGGAMGIAREIGQNLRGPSERWLGVDHPVFAL